MKTPQPKVEVTYKNDIPVSANGVDISSQPMEREEWEKEFDKVMATVVIHGNKYPCQCCGEIHIEMTDPDIAGDELATHDKAKDFIRTLLSHTREEAIREGQERAAEIIKQALYKAEKNDPRWVPVRMRGWEHCKSVVLESLQKQPVHYTQR